MLLLWLVADIITKAVSSVFQVSHSHWWLLGPIAAPVSYTTQTGPIAALVLYTTLTGPIAALVLYTTLTNSSSGLIHNPDQ